MARKPKPRASRRGRRKSALLGTVGVVLVVAVVWLIWPFWHLAGQFADRALEQPSRLYGAPDLLTLGERGSAAELLQELEGGNYRPASGAAPAVGEFEVIEGGVRIHLRSTPTAGGWREAGRAEVLFSGGRIASLSWAGAEVPELSLEAPLVASYYGADRRERRPARLEDLPEELTRAVLAAEDARFFDHRGLSPRGMLRALWVNIREGGVRQGGSTLTQQLVKNLFLTHERTLGRKLREMVLAVLVDWRYSKPAILGAYLNEIYWGEWNGANVMGVGAAAMAYFGKDPTRLTLCEATVLAGMIHSPGSYDPARHPERARERRDWVLDRMADLDWLTAERAARAKRQPLCHAPGRKPVGGARYFRDRVRGEAGDRFGIRELDDAGYTILSTLDPRAQGIGEEAVEWGVEALEQGWEKGRDRSTPLQAALISIDPATGEVRAYVGGRDYRASQFDRAGSARRQAGSAFKPVVYAAAFDQGAVPADLLADEPLSVEVAGSGTWTPQNSDDKFRGLVTARRALEESLNVPTARLALQVGLDEIAAMTTRLGVDRRLNRVPSMALGALEVTPLELATVYTTLAAGGVRRQPHFVTAVLGPTGDPVAGRPLPTPEEALSPEDAYLVTSVLEGVFDRGTAKVVRQWGMVDRLAGKTGTTNDRRDSWFAGYSPDRATLVWVGYDDNATTRLSGSRAALPIWNRFTWRLRPAGGYRPMRPPRGITTATVDPLSGELAISRCPTYATELFPRDRVPTEICHLHAGPLDRRVLRAEARAREREGRFKRWLDRVFKKRRDEPPD